jgi:hypothetical protein
MAATFGFAVLGYFDLKKYTQKAKLSLQKFSELS